MKKFKHGGGEDIGGQEFIVLRLELEFSRGSLLIKKWFEKCAEAKKAGRVEPPMPRLPLPGEDRILGSVVQVIKIPR